MGLAHYSTADEKARAQVIFDKMYPDKRIPLDPDLDVDINYMPLRVLDTLRHQQVHRAVRVVPGKCRGSPQAQHE